MFLLLFLGIRDEITESTSTKKTYSAGYYNFKLVGGQGGKACYSGKKVEEYEGGHGAVITGKLHLKGNYEYTIVVGGSPEPTCNENINKGAKYGEGGWSGLDKETWSEAGGGGGGYSLFEIDRNHLIAISGGGAGASAYTNGASAGGKDYNFKINSNGKDERCEPGKEDRACFTVGRFGGNGAEALKYPGSGGGGGAKGGYANSWAFVFWSVWDSVARGGSSDWNVNYFYEGPEVTVGINNGATGTGSFFIESISICNTSCYDCDNGNETHCTECFPGDFLFNNECYKSCLDTPKPTYPDGNQCKPCKDGCTFCIDGENCSTCRFDQMKDDSGNCVPLPERTPLPSLAPSPSPSIAPLQTPHASPSMTPEIIEVENPTQSSDSKHVDGLGGGTPNGNEGENKVPLGLIIGIIVGVLALIGIIAFAVYYCTRSHEANDSFEEDMAEETAMSSTELTCVTLDNPIFTTSVNQDAFKDDFDENESSEIFHLHDEEV